jgi:hypothetical protein
MDESFLGNLGGLGIRHWLPLVSVFRFLLL